MSDLSYANTRQPMLKVLSNNKEIQGVISASVSSNNYYRCDHFSLEFAASAGPPGWWDVEPPLIVDVQFSADGGQSFTSLIIGEVDSIAFNIAFGVVTMDGRDLSAQMIEAKTQEAFVNQTSSQIAQTIAARHNLKANVVATSTLVDRYYTQDHTRGTLDQFSKTTTEWDLLTYLAQQEGYNLFMTGTTLNFVPDTADTSSPVNITWQMPSPVPQLNAKTLSMQRSLTLAKDVQVQVRSWNSRQQRSFTKTAKALGGKAASASGSSSGKPTATQNYVFIRPNLTEDQAQKLATQYAADITKHERVVSVEMPGELSLTPRSMIAIKGTSTSFDQTYFIDTIERHLSFDGGFQQSLRLKNTSPRTQTQV